MQNGPTQSPTLIAFYLSRIICPNSNHTRHLKYTCKHRCNLLCKPCFHSSRPSTFAYICTHCLHSFCIHHYSTHFNRNINETIFNCRHIGLLNKWIGNKPRYSLIFKASLHGYTSEAFHKKCDGKAPTVTILKNQFGKIIGGYTSSPWSLGGSIADHSATTFVFSMNLNKRFPINAERCEYALFGYQSYCAVFGGGHCEATIFIGDHCNSASSFTEVHTKDYNIDCTNLEFGGSIDGNYRFSINDYEVYLVENGNK